MSLKYLKSLWEHHSMLESEPSSGKRRGETRGESAVMEQSEVCRFLYPVPLSSLLRLQHKSPELTRLEIKSSVYTMDYFAYSVIFATLSLLACLACVPPLLIHIKARNVAAIVLTLGIAILCFLNSLNALIWRSEDQDTWWDGKILCDIEVKLYIGQGVSVDGVLLCLFRQIATILDTEHMSVAPSRRQRNITLVIEICLCIVLPSLVMTAHYVVQRPRYWIRRIAGCTPSFDNSWPSFVLIYIWPMALCLAACVYCAVAMVRLWRHRRELSAVLSDTPGATRSQNYRLISFAVILLLIYLPLNTVAFVGNMSTPRHIYSWSYIHPPNWADVTTFYPVATPSFDRWAQTVTAYVLFGVFGLGRDTKQMYRSWFQWLKKCFGQAAQRRNQVSTTAAPTSFQMSSHHHGVDHL